MQGSKIRLSPPEAELFGNRDIILTKNSVLQKTAALLGQVQEALVEQAPSFIKSVSPPPKISKGENYLGLPYLILDYPRIAAGEDLFFVRSLFWWGHFYSSTLQLSGAFKQKHFSQLENAYPTLSDNGYFIGVNPDPWVHHFEVDNFQPIRNLSKKAFGVVLEETLHVKIAKQWPLQEWDSAEEKLTESWRLLTSLMAEG